MTVQIIGKPQLRFTQSGNPILEVSANLAPRRFNKQTSEWEQDGEDQWTRGTIWSPREDRPNDPHPEAIMAACPDGWRVILEADRVKRTTYVAKTGETKMSDELVFPRFVGFAPPRDLVKQQGQSYQPQSSTPAQSAYAQPAGNPWEQSAAVESAPSYSQADAPF